MKKTVLIFIVMLLVVLMAAPFTLEAKGRREKKKAVEEVPVEEVTYTTKSGVTYTPKPNDYGFKTVPPDEVLVGDIIIVTAHEFQIRQRAAFKRYCDQEGARVIQEAGEFDPERQRKILESMVAQGVQAVNYYGLDPATSKAQSEYLAQNGVASVLQWEDFETVEYPWPVVSIITSDNNASTGGVYAANWFDKKYGKDAKVIGGVLDSPAFRNCTMRIELFMKGFEEAHSNVEWFIADGKGMRDAGRQAGEALIQANPKMQIAFGCNDDSTLGFMAALEAAGKTPDNFCLIGFDGTIASYDAIKRGTILRADVAQDPEGAGYNGGVVSVQIARGEKTFGDFPRHMLVNVCSLVTLDNMDPYYEKAAKAVEMIKLLEKE